MMTPTNQQPLKRTRPTRGDTTIPPPESLGVLEFSSALNSDDPLLIFHKLVHFVKLVRYERHVALSDDGDCIDEVGCDDDDDDDDDGHDDRCDVDLVDHDDIILLDVVGVGGGGSDDNDTIDPSKRLKLNDGLSSSSSKPKNKTPSWKLDTNNYQVPFVGTSVAKGPTGTLTHNVWPTGFMEAYRKTSPYGVELLNNEYISALPSEGDGVHAHNLCKATSAQGGSSGGGECGKKKKPNNTCNSTTLLDHPPTRGQILSMAIQCAYWNAVSEWILGFISMQTLRNDLQWMNYDGVVSSEMNFAPSDKKCTVPPSVMTTLMKLRLPEWVDAIHNYSYRLQKYAQQRQKEQHQMKLHQKQQQQQQQTKKKNQDYPPEDGHDNSQRNENEKQQLRDEEVLQREAKLFLSSMNNLIALCHLSTGTAREVLRRLMLPTTTATKAETTSKRNIDKLKQKPFIGGGNKPGAGGSVTTPWMLLVFQNRHCSKSMFRTQLECLRLVCTLLETKDHMIISRLIDTSSSVKQGSGGGRSKGPSGGCGSAKNVSLAYVALQNGMQRLMDLVNDDGMDRESRLFARYIARLLRNVSEVVLPHSSEGSSIADKSGDGSGITEAADLLVGEVLTNLTKLSALAPPFDADAKSIQSIIDAKDSYDNLNPIRFAAIEARRMLFLLLADTDRSPLLHGIHHRLGLKTATNTTDEQSVKYLSQLSQALHGMLASQGHDQSINMLFGICLRTTPQLVPYFLSGLQLSNARPTFRSLAALNFIEGILREAPLPSRTLSMKPLLSSLIPSRITKLLLSKIIQSQSSLLVSSGLKLMITILRRVIDFTSASMSPTGTNSDGASTEQWKCSISHSIFGQLPEVTLLLSIQNRFDPFSHDPTSNANSLVSLLLCEVLICLATLDSTLMINVKFDWTKLVPNESGEQKFHGRVFSNAEPLLQQRIMHVMHTLSRGNQTAYSTKFLPNVMSILTSTSIPEVYTNSRNLALVLLERDLFPHFSNFASTVGNSEGKECMEYETSLWIDGISDDIIQELVQKIEESKHQRVQQKIMIAQAWSKNFGLEMPTLYASDYLISSISKLVRDGDSSSSNRLSDLSIQVAARMLLFQADPRPLAAVIVFCTTARILGDKRVAGLYRSAKCILDNETKMNVRREPISFDTFHPERSGVISKLALLDRRADSNTVRQYLSMMKYSKGQKEELNNRVRRLVIGLIVSGNTVTSSLLELLNVNTRKTIDSVGYTALLLSASMSKELSFETVLNCVALSKPAPIGMELTSELLGCSVVLTHRDSTFGSDLVSHCFHAFQSNDDRTADLRHFLIVVLHAIFANDEKSVGPSPGAMFDLWSAVARNVTDTMRVEFCIRLEYILSALFKVDEGNGAWVVYQRICKLSPTKFAEIWLNVQLQKGESKYESECSLLRSVLEYDCSQFSCLLSMFARIGSDNKMTTLWDSGSLDTITAAFVVQTNKQKDAKSIIANASFAEIAPTICSRFMALLSNKKSETQVTNKEILATLEALCSNQHAIPEMRNCILCMCDDSGGLSVDDVRILKLAVSLEIEHQNVPPLLTKVLLRCCQLLPKRVKTMLRMKESAAASDVDSLVGILSSSIAKIDTFDENITANSSHTIHNCIVACLKYGMMEIHDATTCSVLGGCLKVIRLLIGMAYGSSSKSQIQWLLTPSQIHAMAVSHSSFHHCISQRKSISKGYVISAKYDPKFCSGLSRQIELIRLLLCTVSLDGSNVKVELDTWTVILSVYNASTDLADRMLRRLTFLYEQNGCCQDEILLSDLRWGTLAKKNQNADVDESREWFADTIQLDRINLTLSDFPVEDALEPVRFNDVEFTSSDEIGDEADGDSHDANRSRNSGWLLWRATGEDLRYSPGFLLPLILASLDAQLPHDQERHNRFETTDGDCLHDNTSNREEDTIAEHRDFAYTCRRVADKGGIALALASLSSRCPSIRRVAIAICGLFLKALQMDESHGIKSWHERPQQEMIMSSIQRGLALRRSIQIHKKDTHEGGEGKGVSATDGRKYNVPMLPAVSAIFLAKALLVLSKPEDDMYGQMNRYFLRLTDYHGAFQDCFGIPAFLSLYCSSSDDIARSRVERNWALHILKDGVVDEYCYRIISQHHVPELIMSSFDCMIDDPESKSEIYLTIEVIGTFLLAGGKNASDHLIQRQGILSWLHGILSWRLIPLVFLDDSLKCKFLDLITTAVDSFRYYGVGENDFYEKVPLANIVIRICLDGEDPTENEDGMPQQSKMDLLVSTCNALWAIYLADKQSSVTAAFQGLTSIRNQSCLLKKCVRHGNLFEKVLTPLCDLPLISDENDDASAQLFCNLTLRFLLEMKMQVSSDTIQLCMKRVYELVNLHPFLQKDAELQMLITNFRPIAVMAAGHDVWNLFLPYVTN